MATYAIGDVQGCFTALMALVKEIQFDPDKDFLWFTGDLVNRGPDSLSVLRFVKSLADKQCALSVLGNHDLHLLALANHVVTEGPDDHLETVLNAEDADELLTWLRHRPLLHHQDDFTLVHAGLAPQWDLTQAMQLAREVEVYLQGHDYIALLQQMYGNQPSQWQDTLKGFERLRCIINCLTRIRFCSQQGELNLLAKGDLAQAPEGFLPWFQVEGRAHSDLTIIFGHWAALVNQWPLVLKTKAIIPLGSGCVWGNQLTAIRLDDRQRFSVACDNGRGIESEGLKIDSFIFE